MELIDKILSSENIEKAIRKVKSNKGAPGIDNMAVEEIDGYFKENGNRIIKEIRQMRYQPKPVKRVYIPKSDGGKRPLGIPCVVDRVIQQAIAQQLSELYDPYFSEGSFGFRPNRSAHDAMENVLEYLNEGNEWVIDLDIEKYFDTVNHDRLISMIRERVNERETLKLIRSFLKAGVMENGLASPSQEGVPQGGPLSPILSNIYLDKFDRELESRGLRFVRYADDCNIFVKSEMSANRVMKSVTSRLERKLFLKVNATKTKVVKPSDSEFLGFSFCRNGDTWKCVPSKKCQASLYKKIKQELIRKKAVAQKLSVTFRKVNQIMRGWINYYRIGMMKTFLKKFGQWMRHKIRVVIIKQWKRTQTIYANLMKLNKLLKCKFDDESIFKVANSRLGWYRRCGMDVVNFILSPKILAVKQKDRPGLVNPLEYYLIKS